MCVATNAIKFCTCKEKDIEEFSIGKWVLYRHRENFDDSVVGLVETTENLGFYGGSLIDPTSDGGDEWRTDVKLEKYFQSRLNKDSVFDFKFQCEPGDYLLIKLKNKIMIELFFNYGVWQPFDESSPFQNRCRIMKGKALVKLQISDEDEK